MNICIFGDSITEGFYDREKGGWVDRLKKMRPDDEIFNFGISGDTTEDVLKRFDKDIVEKNPYMIIFAIGINDSLYLNKEKHNKVVFDKFERNIAELISRAKKCCPKIIFVGLVAIDERILSPIPWYTIGSYFDVNVKKYDNAIKKICKEYNLVFIDIYQEMKKINYKKLLDDGIHPNAAGHQWLAEEVNKKLINI